jgi:uncharacterized protein YegP (UPF0339 family)
MATATKKARAAAPVTVREVSESSLEFLVYRDNGGGYHWEIVQDSGESLIHSVSFGSHEDAERAARYVYDRAGVARFGPQEADERQPTAA